MYWCDWPNLIIGYENYSRCKGVKQESFNRALSANNGCTIKRNHRGRQTWSGLYACSRMRHACASSSIYKYTYASGKISVDRYLVPVASRSPFTHRVTSVQKLEIYTGPPRESIVRINYFQEVKKYNFILEEIYIKFVVSIHSSSEVEKEKSFSFVLHCLP